VDLAAVVHLGRARVVVENALLGQQAGAVAEAEATRIGLIRQFALVPVKPVENFRLHLMQEPQSLRRAMRFVHEDREGQEKSWRREGALSNRLIFLWDVNSCLIASGLLLRYFTLDLLTLSLEPRM